MIRKSTNIITMETTAGTVVVVAKVVTIPNIHTNACPAKATFGLIKLSLSADMRIYIFLDKLNHLGKGSRPGGCLEDALMVNGLGS